MVLQWYHGGEVRCWFGTCVDTLAPSHASLAERECGVIAADEEQRKYSLLESTHYFVPVAVETLGPFSEETQVFLRELAR